HVARCNDGRQIPVDVSVSRLDFDDADLFAVILRDISDRKAPEREHDHRATHDALTGLPHREALYRRVDAELASSAKLPRMALLLRDLGRFGEVNDPLGHDVGDALLAEAGSRIGGVVGERGFVARIGADEFTVLLAPV